MATGKEGLTSFLAVSNPWRMKLNLRLISFFAMFEEHQRQIQKLGKAASTALRVHDFLKNHRIVSFPAVSNALVNLQKIGLVREFTGKRRYRLYSCDPYLTVLTRGTER